jgi:hypothetical protein
LIRYYVLRALVLLGVGAYQAVTLVGNCLPGLNGLQVVVIGLSAAAIGFLIGLCSTPPEHEPQTAASLR